MNAILLFDIDGTLVDTEGAGLRALRRGLHDAFPATAAHSFPSLDLGGATDGGVIAFLFSHFSIENSSENRVEFYAAYEGALSDELYRSREAGRGRVLPGVADLLRHLEQNHDDKGRGLLTGNSENGARIKLQHFGIDGPFSFGAFGDDHHDRNRLGPIALDRAAKTHGREFSGTETIVIGDTIKDIRCARAFDASVIAVATGTVPWDQLAAADPDKLLDDLSDLEAVINAVESLLS